MGTAIPNYYNTFDRTKGYNELLFISGVDRYLQSRELNELQSIIKDQIKLLGDKLFLQGNPIMGLQVSITFDNTNGTGTVTFSGTTVTGSGTNFLTFFSPNDKIKIGSNIGVVSSITSDTTLTLTAAIPTITVGTSYSKQNNYKALINDGLVYYNGTLINYTANGNKVALTGVGTEIIGLIPTNTTITEVEDPSLRNIAIGTPSLGFPGAYRNQLTLTAGKNTASNTPNAGMVELQTIQDGTLVVNTLVTTNLNSNYVTRAALDDILAVRIYDLFGHVITEGFNCKLQTSTNTNNFRLAVSPGKALVSGYEVINNETQYIELPKALDTRLQSQESHVFNTTNASGYINFKGQIPDSGTIKIVINNILVNNKTTTVTINYPVSNLTILSLRQLVNNLVALLNGTDQSLTTISSGNSDTPTTIYGALSNQFSCSADDLTLGQLNIKLLHSGNNNISITVTTPYSSGKQLNQRNAGLLCDGSFATLGTGVAQIAGGSGSRTIALNLTPVQSITSVTGLVPVSQTLTRGASTADLLGNTPVGTITSVTAKDIAAVTDLSASSAATVLDVTSTIVGYDLIVNMKGNQQKHPIYLTIENLSAGATIISTPNVTTISGVTCVLVTPNDLGGKAGTNVYFTTTSAPVSFTSRCLVDQTNIDVTNDVYIYKQSLYLQPTGYLKRYITITNNSGVNKYANVLQLSSLTTGVKATEAETPATYLGLTNTNNTLQIYDTTDAIAPGESITTAIELYNNGVSTSFTPNIYKFISNNTALSLVTSDFSINTTSESITPYTVNVVSIQNTSVSTLTGNFYISLESLTAGVTLVDSIGNNPSTGAPMQLLYSGNITAGATVKAIVRFYNPSNLTITYTAKLNKGLSTTYVKDTDYTLAVNSINWLTSNKPPTGTLYTVNYTQSKTLSSSNYTLSNNSITFNQNGDEPAPASVFYANYYFYLNRLDTIGLDQDGNVIRLAGLPELVPIEQSIPDYILPLANVLLKANGSLSDLNLEVLAYDAITLKQYYELTELTNRLDSRLTDLELSTFGSTLALQQQITDLTTRVTNTESVNATEDTQIAALQQSIVSINNQLGVLDSRITALEPTVALLLAVPAAPILHLTTATYSSTYWNNVYWDAVFPAVGYSLEYALTAAGPWFALSANVSNTNNLLPFYGASNTGQISPALITNNLSIPQYTHTSLQPATAYYYRARAYNWLGYGNYSGIVNVVTGGTAPTSAPNAPTLNTVTSTYNSNTGKLTNTITFTAPGSGATPSSYNIYRATSSGGYTTSLYSINASGSPYTVYDDSSITSGATFYYIVKSVTVVGESVASNEVNVVNAITPTAATAPPSPELVNGVASYNTDTSAFTNTFTLKGSTSAVSYTIQRKTGIGGTYATITPTQVGSGITYTYTDSASIAANTQYYYKASATNGIGTSAYSVELILTSLATAPTLAAPTNLTASTNSITVTQDYTFNFTPPNSYPISISPPSAIAGLYGVKAFMTKSTWDDYGVIGSYTSPVINSGTFTYSGSPIQISTGTGNITGYVNNYSADNGGGLTLTIQWTGNVTPVSTPGITLSWKDSSTIETGFQIYRSTSPTGGFVLLLNPVTSSTTTVSSTTTSTTGTTYTYTDSTVTGGVTYYYTVNAIATATIGTSSNIASATALQLVPNAPVVSLTTYQSQIYDRYGNILNSSTSFNMSWAAVNTATSYKIYRSASLSSGYSLLTSTSNTSYSDVPTISGVYYYYIVASNIGGDSAQSNTVSGTSMVITGGGGGGGGGNYSN